MTTKPEAEVPLWNIANILTMLRCVMVPLLVVLAILYPDSVGGRLLVAAVFVGLGWAGLPMAEEPARAGLKVVAIESRPPERRSRRRRHRRGGYAPDHAVRGPHVRGAARGAESAPGPRPTRRRAHGGDQNTADKRDKRGLIGSSQPMAPKTANVRHQLEGICNAV